MDIKSLFSRDKPSTLILPDPPTVRDMIEDIGDCHINDPVIGLAQLLDKRNRQSSMDSRMSESSFLVLPSKDNDIDYTYSSTTPWSTKNILSVPSKPNFTTTSGAKNSTRSSKSNDSSEKAEHVYWKLKQFTVIHNQSQELISQIEPALNTLENNVSDFSKSLPLNDFDYTKLL